MKIRKRNGDLVDFEVDKIQTAIKKAFNDTNTEITEEIKKIGKYIKRKIEKDDSLANVESIQDLVEVELQKRGYYQEAKEYILYRDKRNKHRTLMSKFDKIVNDKKILAIIDEIPKEFEEERYPLESFYQKVEAFTGKTNITEKEILDSLIKASSELTDKNSPDWEFIAARFLMYKLDKEIDRNEEKYGIVDFKTKIKFLEKDGRYGSYILENYSSEEIDELEDYINKDYDKLLTYSGLDLLIKRYIIKTKEDEPLERVQEMFMGIAMHLAMNEENKIGFAKDVYDILASLKATMATPTMSNARKPHHQLSSCFIDTVDDSLEGIFDSVSRFAKVSKFGGGMGMYMGKVRANGSDIRGYKGAAGGVIRWIRIINDTAVAVDQLGCVAKNSYVKVLESVKTNNFTHRYLKRAEKYNKDIDKKYIELVTNEAKNHAFKYGTFSKSTIENLLSDYVNRASPNSSINKYSLSNQQYKKIIGKFKKIDKPVIDGFVRIKTNPDYAINESGDILNLKSYKFLNSYRINKKGYIEATIGKKKYPLHSLLYETFIGSRNGFTIDHIDKNKLNNQLSNLQLLSNEENISKGWNTKSEIDKRSESIKVKAHLSYNKALNGKRRNSIPTEILEIKEKIVPISDVQTGDLIKSLNPNTGKVVYKEVEALHDITVKHKDQIKIKYENGSYIVTSLWHPTYNKKPNEEKFEFIRADQVEVGDVGLSENLEENKVVEVDFNPQYDEDYKDLTIKDTNCYFVSTDDEFNDMFLIHNTRQGSVACYLDLWHKDMPEFLGLRTNNGDDRMKAHDVFPAICVPDLFWRLCRDDINATWYMFDPHEVEQKYGKALEDTYGEEWEEFYNTLVADKNISKRTIQVKELVRLIIKSWAETGTPFVFNRDTVNKMNPNKHAGMIYSSNLCVTGDTQILTSKGYRKVIDLYNSQEDFNVIVDDRARTMNTDNKTVSVQKSTKMFKTKENTEIYKMTLSNGQELKATPYHKMYRLNEDKEVEKVELKDLAIKDKILIQNSEGYYGYNHNPELAYLMGVWAAEGTITRGRKKENNSAMLSLFGKKQEHKENIEELISVLLENRNDLVERQSVLNPKFKRYRDKSIIHSAPLYKLFKEFSYDLRDKVVVPNYIKQADKDTQIAYISGILSFDGCVTKTGCIELISTDTMFLRDIQNILLNMGIFSSIYKGKEAGKYEMPDGKGGLKLYKCNQTHKLTIARGMLPKIYKKFNLSSWQAKRITEIMGSDPEFYNIDRTYSTVKSIKVLEEKEDVYDVTVENGHSLIFNGIVTGNCSEICQNMSSAEVMEEKVTTKDGDTVIVKTDRPGDFVECNLASLTLGNLDVNNKEELEHTINTIVRALDNVIDLNYYPTPYAEVTNKRYRAIGLGTSGYHHMLVKNGIRWSDKEEHLEFADRVYEDINYYTIKASMNIAKEKGPYELFEGSDWQTGDYFDLRNYNSDRWEELRKDVKKYGIRNSYLMAIAPTGSTSIISGTSAGVDPIMSRYFLEEKKGSIVPRVAPGLDNRTFWLYENAHNVDQNITVEATGVRQRHIDQSQSVNIYITTNYTMRQILNIYINAWENGVKSLYYVRGKSLEIEDCEVCSA